MQHFVSRYCYLHDVNRSHWMMVDWDDVLIEHCYTERNGQGLPVPADMQRETHVLIPRNVRNLVVRYNVFQDSRNSFFPLEDVVNAHISSNVFLFGAEPWGDIYAVIESYGAHQVQVANNTFYHLSGLNVGISFREADSDITVYNNLWTDCVSNQVMLTSVHDYNGFFNNWREGEYLLDDRIEEPHVQVFDSDPLVGAAAGDFSLRAPTEPGQILAAPLDIDPNGVRRGADGVWDRGAFEYTEAD